MANDIESKPAAEVRQQKYWHSPASLLIMLFSGFSGLGYQIIWTQQSALWLGHESTAVLAVVTAFFGGLALGALLIGMHTEKSNTPIRWYVSCEWIIASWGLILAFSMHPLSTWLVNIIGSQPSPIWQWSAIFIVSFFLLLPATASMGATLPAMHRVMSASSNNKSISILYASNTIGAVIGVLIVAFYFIPKVGLINSSLICVGMNLISGALSLAIFNKKEILKFNDNYLILKTQQRNTWPLLQLFFTGLLGIGFEIIATRILSQVTEGTVYTFSTILAVYLICTSIGAAFHRSIFSKKVDEDHSEAYLFGALTLACLASTASVWYLERIQSFCLESLGNNVSTALITELILAVCTIGPPAIVMGAVFVFLCNRTSELGINFSKSLGYNLVGATVAPIIFGVLVLPAIGQKNTLLVIALIYLLLVKPKQWNSVFFWFAASAVLASFYLISPLALIDIPRGGRVIKYEEGVMAAVSIIEDKQGIATLRINNRQQEGSSATLRVDARQALLPILLHAKPKRALFLGLGTGVTASSAALLSDLSVDAAELLPEVINASEYFTKSLIQSKSDSNLNIINTDARRYVLTSHTSYDIIIADNFHPARSGSGSLYTVEHFASIANLLTDMGIFCQWLPLHQLDLDSLRSIVKSFMTIYPNGWAMLANNSLETPVIGLVALNSSSKFDLDVIRNRLSNIDLPQQLKYIGIEDEYALLGGFIANSNSLNKFSESAALNTDDQPIVSYSAPMITYWPNSTPRERLVYLIRHLSISPNDVVDLSSMNDSTFQLASYWHARNAFIELGQHIDPQSDPNEIMNKTKEPLLSILRISPEFRPAYDPLLMMALSLTETDKLSSISLLKALQAIQPKRTESTDMLNQLKVDQ